MSGTTLLRSCTSRTCVTGVRHRENASTVFAVALPVQQQKYRGRDQLASRGLSGVPAAFKPRASTLNRFGVKKAQVNTIRTCFAQAGSLIDQITAKNAKHPVMVYSKSWCPFCSQIKSMFEVMEVEYTAVELDKIVEESDIQQALMEMTGQRTVPSIFIGGQHIGGCDDAMALHRSGKLEQMLAELKQS